MDLKSTPVSKHNHIITALFCQGTAFKYIIVFHGHKLASFFYCEAVRQSLVNSATWQSRGLSGQFFFGRSHYQLAAFASDNQDFQAVVVIY